MTKINWGRLILGTLIAAIIMFVSDGFVHETIAKADWKAVYAGAALYKDATKPAVA